MHKFSWVRTYIKQIKNTFYLHEMLDKKMFLFFVSGIFVTKFGKGVTYVPNSMPWLCHLEIRRIIKFLLDRFRAGLDDDYFS